MSSIKSLLTLSLTSSLAFAQSGDPVAAETVDDLLAETPNVVLIIADDLGYGDFSFLGASAVKTPALDKLAASSALWENFYVSPLGSLTRSSLYTGRYNPRTKVLGNSKGLSVMAEDELTLAEVMSANGYKTGLFGTWGLGDNYPSRATDQGFQTTLTHRGSGLGLASDVIDSKKDDKSILLLSNNYESRHKGNANDAFFDAAEAFIKDSNKHGTSFFVTISPTQHAKECLSQPVVDAGSNKAHLERKLASKVDFVKDFDRNVGELTELLKAEGILNNTIVVVLSDNGPQHPHTEASLRGSKGELYEGAVRSPLLISWPDKIKQGFTISDNVAGHIDIMPTLLHACGYGVEDAFDYDGQTLLPKITDPKTTLPERAFVQQSHSGQRLSKYHHFMVRQGGWKLVNPSDASKSRADSRNYELYHLAADPKEQRNLAEEQKEKVQELERIYANWYKDVTETRLRDSAPSYILIDRRRENPVTLTWQERISRESNYQTPGFWKLDFEHDGRADVQVEFPLSFAKDLTGWTATLTLGKKQFTHEVHSGEHHYLFSGVEYNKGRHHLRCTFSSPDGKETISAYQVRIQHR